MIQTKNKILKSIIITSLIIFAISCSSVFSAGVSGRVVDAESTSSPKDGIADVTVFVYIDEAARDADFNAWTAGSRFSPATTKHYIGQTSTANDGSFTIGRIVWESFSPEFGKTADFTPIYLLFFHEDFGLVKNSNKAVIMSDSTSNVIYQEMKSIRKSTSLEIQIRNASSDTVLNIPVNVKISVPQINGLKEYEVSITGTGSVRINYPRSGSDGNPFTPEIIATYSQLGSSPDYKACMFNSDSYVFIADNKTSQTVSGSTFPIKLYMKALTLTISSTAGQINYGIPAADSMDEGTSDDDNIVVLLAYEQDGKLIQYPEISSRVRTFASGDGANGSRIRHGLFSGLGQGINWKNDSYTGKYDLKTVYIVIDRDENEIISEGDFYYTKTVRSDEENLNLGILSSSVYDTVTNEQL